MPSVVDFIQIKRTGPLLGGKARVVKVKWNYYKLEG